MIKDKHYRQGVEDSNLELPPGRPIDWEASIVIEKTVIIKEKKSVCIHAESAFDATRAAAIHFGVSPDKILIKRKK